MHTLTLSLKPPPRTTAVWLTAAQRAAVTLLIDSALNGYEGPNGAELQAAADAINHPLRFIESYDVGTTTNAAFNLLDDGHLASIGADIVTAIQEDQAGRERRPNQVGRWRTRRNDTDAPTPSEPGAGDPRTWR